MKTNILFYEQFKKLYSNTVYEDDCEFLMAITESLYEHGQVLLDKVFQKLDKFTLENYYESLYRNTNVDFIGWQIDNGIFDWEKYSCLVVEFCPQNFDKNKFNWEKYSWAVVRYAPHLFDPKKFNWKEHAWYVKKYAPRFMIYCPEQYK